MLRIFPTLALIGAALFFGTPSFSNSHLAPTCIKDAMRDFTSVNDVRLLNLIEDIKLKFADRAKYVVVSCDLIENALAFYPPEGSDLPKHKYLIINEGFFRLATRNNVAQQHFILGHEIGHHANNDFASDLPRRLKELYADVKAACAVAHLGGTWDEVDDILRALRFDPADTPEYYPSYPESQSEARLSFDACLPMQREGAVDPISPETPDRSVYLVVQPKGPTINAFKRVVGLVNSKGITASGTVNAPASVAQLTVRTQTEPAVLGQLSKDWSSYSEWIMAFMDGSYEFDTAEPPLPTINGVFFLGPTAPDTAAISFSLPRSGQFLDNERAALLNLMITEDLVSVLVGFAALKDALDNNYSVSVVRLYADFTDQALLRLRSHSEYVDKFSDWIKDLKQVDELLLAAQRFLSA